MTTRLPDTLLSRLSDYLAERMGFHFSPERWPDLERAIRSAAREFEFDDTESCVQWLISSPVTLSQIEILANHLTVGETYFFRERASFEILQERVFPELIQKRGEVDQRVRIWSAGCCTGEEPYSIAILLKQILPDLQDWQITILATDINPRFLQKASDGVYGEWAFRGVPSRIKERYFLKRHNGRFEILPEIKKMVTFSYLNLAEDAYPSVLNNTNAMDVILCRNVLMYFAPERAKLVIQKFHCSLLEGGWLVVSPSESSHILYAQFEACNFPEVIFYKKDVRRAFTGAPYGLQEKSPPSRQLSVPVWSVPPLENYHSLPESPEETAPPETPQATMAEPQQSPYAFALDLYERGLYEQAAGTLSTMLAHDPRDATAMALMGRIYANQGKLVQAVRWCEKAIAIEKLNPHCHILHAAVLQEQGALAEAIRALQRALYLDQNLVLAHFALGNIARRQGKSKEAAKHFQNARLLLDAYSHEEILPESEGMTAGRLMEIIRSTNKPQVSASESGESEIVNREAKRLWRGTHKREPGR